MVEKEREKKEEKKKREIRGPWNGIVEAFRNFRSGIPFGLVYELRNGPCAHRAPLRDYTTRLHDEINTCTRVSARACVDAHQYSRVMFQEITSNAIFYSFKRLYTPLRFLLPPRSPRKSSSASFGRLIAIHFDVVLSRNNKVTFFSRKCNSTKYSMKYLT